MITPEQVRMARAAVGWSIRELAEKAELHHNTISRVEQGKDTTKGTLLVIKSALEGAGVVFVDPNGLGPGVRLREK